MSGERLSDPHGPREKHRSGIEEDRRWMIRRDMPEVLAIEQASFGKHAWDEDEFELQLRDRQQIAMVCEHGDAVVGYIVYRLHDRYIEILRLAVCPDHRQLGAGGALVQRMIDSLSHERRNHIVADVNESNLGAQLFFRSLGFFAASVARDETSNEDAYRMEYWL